MKRTYRIKIDFAFFPNGAKITCFELTGASDEREAIDNIRERYRNMFWYEIKDCKLYQS